MIGIRSAEQEEFEDVKETYRVSSELIKEYPNLSGIYVTEGTTPEGTAQAIKNSGNIDKIKIYCTDNNSLLCIKIFCFSTKRNRKCINGI